VSVTPIYSLNWGKNNCLDSCVLGKYCIVDSKLRKINSLKLKKNIPDGCEESSQMYSQGTGKSAQLAGIKIIKLLPSQVDGSNICSNRIS
jgi:hypothetical protein